MPAITLSETAARGAGKRDNSLDILRGLAVGLMIFHHVGTWLYVDSIRDLISIVGRISVGDLAPPIFFTVSGMSLFYAVRSMAARSAAPGDILKNLFLRGLKIYITGSLLCFIAFGRESFFYWGVLQSLAVSILLAGALYLLPARRIMLLSASILALAGYYYFLPYKSLLPGAVARVLGGDFALPLVAGFVTAGLFLGTYVLPGNWGPRALAAAGASLTICGLVANFFGLAITRYPASISYIFFVLGLILLLYAALKWLDLQKSFFLPVIYAGRNALNVFILHYLFYLFFKHAGFKGACDDLYAIGTALVITAFFLFFSRRVSWLLKALPLKLF